VSPTYPPLDTLKPVAANLWIVDGPVIRFGFPVLKMSFPTRMTIIRLAGRRLFLHSPTPLTPALRAEILSAGIPHWILAPNRLHYWWVREWRDAFADAAVYLAPRIREQAGARIAFDGLPLDRNDGYPWDEEIATLPVVGTYMTEIVFFHRRSRTLVLTDLIESSEPEKVESFFWRWLIRLGGVQHPDGQTPSDLRRSFAGPQLRAAVARMLAWQPERIIFAHGRWIERNGTTELRRAFRWAFGGRPPQLDAPVV
jgi:hypothetical protein